MRSTRKLVAAGAAAALALGLAACGEDEEAAQRRGRDPDPRDDRPAGLLRPGRARTTCRPTTSSSTCTRTCMQVPPGGNKPEPEAAESLRVHRRQGHGLRVHAARAASSSPTAPTSPPRTSRRRSTATSRSPTRRAPPRCYLNLKDIETPDDQTVVFNLKASDATWPFLLTTGGAAIVPAEYPADKVQASDRGDRLRPLHGRRVRARPADSARGERRVHGRRPGPDRPVIIQYFDKSSTLKQAVEQGEVDIAYRSLSPTDIDDLEGAEGVNVERGRRAREIRYLNFNIDLQEGSDEQKLAVRQAVAQVIDRESIAEQRLQRHRDAAVLDGPVGRSSSTPRRSPTSTARSPDVGRRDADARGRRRRDARCRSRSGGRRRTTAPRPATSTPRSSASSTRAGCST